MSIFEDRLEEECNKYVYVSNSHLENKIFLETLLYFPASFPAEEFTNKPEAPAAFVLPPLFWHLTYSHYFFPNLTLSPSSNDPPLDRIIFTILSSISSIM